jgi:hypothetical protein
MFQRKVEKLVKRVFWRMSSANPAGVYLTSAGCEPTATAAAPLEAYERGLRGSAFELSSGAEVVETSMDSLPGDVVDQFSRARG